MPVGLGDSVEAAEDRRGRVQEGDGQIAALEDRQERRPRVRSLVAVEDDDVKAIVFRVDSPGGSYVASDAIWREVVRARKGGRPVVISMGNVAASGGYFVAMPADKIVAQPGTITGSIGVLGGKMLTRGSARRPPATA